jgi:hypothetical protein
MTVVGPLLIEEDGTIDAFVEGLKVKRHSYRMQKTGFGPMTPRVMCHDVFSGEVFEWRWKDDLRHEFLADSMPTVADVRMNVTGFVNDLERRVAAPGNTYTAQRVALWTYEALGRQPPAGLMRVADGRRRRWRAAATSATPRLSPTSSPSSRAISPPPPSTSMIEAMNSKTSPSSTWTATTATPTTTTRIRG